MSKVVCFRVTDVISPGGKRRSGKKKRKGSGHKPGGKRKGRKLTGKAKAAFKARMAAGRAKAKRR